MYPMEPGKIPNPPFHKLRGAALPLLNLLLFKLTWLLLVLGQQSGLPWALALQALSLAMYPGLRSAMLPALGVAVGGITIDLLCQISGLFVFPQDRFPLWLAALWLAFAFALPQGLAFLRNLRLPVLAGLGVLVGPLSYGIGYRMGAVDFGLPLLPTLTLLALIWALFLPCAVHVSRLQLRPLALLLVFFAASLPSGQDAMAGEALPQQARHLIGRASLSWFFRPVYNAWLYADTESFVYPPHSSFTFMLEYRLPLKQQQIIKETLRQWEKQQVNVPAEWAEQLKAIIPDVRAGDRLALQVDADQRANMLHNDHSIGRIDDADFVLAFAGIWLAETTTRPDLRQQLLGLP